MKIYTKKGDQGETQLFGAKKVSKADLRVVAYGNSFIGLTVAHIEHSAPAQAPQVAGKQDEILRLKKLQRELFKLSSQVACVDSAQYAKLSKIEEDLIEQLEDWIDMLQSELPALKNFILPGGGLVGAHLHICRTECRKCERVLVELKLHPDSRNDSNLVESLQMGIKFLNRLSDYFFVSARWHNFKSQIPDEIW
jgi:cob(I)alamin adenosyltransferase